MDIVNVQKRDFSVKAPKLRRLGFVPGSIFGKHLEDSIPIQIEKVTANMLDREKREGSRVTLKLGKTSFNVQVKEKSSHPVTGEILNINFQALTADEKVNSILHIEFINDERISGIVDKMIFEVPYSALPADMIDFITVDMDRMQIGSVLHLKDIEELNTDKIELKMDPESIVVRVTDKAASSLPEEEEAGEGEESESAEE